MKDYFDVPRREVLKAYVAEQQEIGSRRRGYLGLCATAAPSFLRARARSLFLAALHRVVPTILEWLLSRPEVIAYFELFDRTREWVDDQLSAGRIPLSDEDVDDWYRTNYPYYRDIEVAEQGVDAAVEHWQRHHRLRDQWLFESARESVQLYGLMFAMGMEASLRQEFPDGLPLLLRSRDFTATPHDGLSEADAATYRMILVTSPILDIRRSSISTNGDDNDEVTIGTFDPRGVLVEVGLAMLTFDLESRLRDHLRTRHAGEIGEADSIDEVVAMEMPNLERRLKEHLFAVVEEDKASNGAVDVVEFRNVAAYERLARYQLFGLSRNKIAPLDSITRQGVGVGIRKAADLIGLTLRIERGGRPSHRSEDEAHTAM